MFRTSPASFLAGLVAAACAVLGLATAAIAQPALSGPRFWIDSETPDHYAGLAVAAGPDGGFAVAWVEGQRGEESFSYAVKARRFDAAGGRLGPAVSLAEDSGEVDVAVNRTGEALVVWVKDRLGLRSRRLDSAGRPLGRIRSLDAGSGRDFGSPQVVAHPDGGFLVVWRRDFTFVARRVFANGTLGRQTVLPFSIDTCAFVVFDVAISRRGDVAMACAGRHRHAIVQILDPDLHPRGHIMRFPLPEPWYEGFGDLVVEFRNDGELAIVGEAYSYQINKGTTFTWFFDLKSESLAAPPLQIDEGGIGSFPTLTVDPAGGLLVVWQRSTNELFGRYIAPSGRLSPTFPLEPDDLGQGRDYRWRAAPLKAGSFVVAWAGRYGILGQRLVSDSPGQIGLRRTHSVALEGEGQALLEAVRREGSRGEILVPWSALGQDALPGEDFEETSGTVTFADGDSLPKRIVIPLRNDDRPEGDESFRVELQDPEGGATLGRSTTARVEIRDDDTPSPLLAGAGQAVQVEELVPSGAAPFYLACCHDLAALSSGDFVAAWQLESGPRVAYALLDATGQPAGTHSVSSPHDPPDQYLPRLLPRPDGGFAMIWRLGTNNLGQEAQGWYTQSFDAGGEPLEEQVPLEGFRSAVDPLRVAPAPDAGFVAVGRRREDSRVDLFVVYYDADGRRLREPVQVNERPIFDTFGLLQEFFLDGPLFNVAANPSGTALVIWPRLPAPGQPGGLFARLVSPSGILLGSEILIGGAAGVIGRLAVAAAPDGGFAVAWESNRDGRGWAISARWLDAAGLPLYEEVTVNSTTTGDQMRPKAAFDPAGDLLVIWRSVGDLRGQLFNAPGHREGSELIIDPVTGGLQTTPAVVARGPGEWRVLWSRVAPDVSQGSVLTRRLARTAE